MNIWPSLKSIRTLLPYHHHKNRSPRISPFENTLHAWPHLLWRRLMANKDDGKIHESEALDKDHQPPSKKQCLGNSVADENPCGKGRGSDISPQQEKQEVKLETSRAHQTLNAVTDEVDANKHGVPLGCKRTKISSEPFDDFVDDLNDDYESEDYSPESDDELWCWGPAKVHGSDISSRREKQEFKLETPRSHQTLNDVTDDDDSDNRGAPLGCEREKISSVPFDDYFDDLNDDEYESDYSPENDHELLFRGPAKLHGSKKRNRPEIYHAYVDPKHRTESQCVDLLKEIGCEDCFVACSIERPNMFFALLNQEEASKLKGVNGIFGAIPRSQIVFDL